MNLALKSLAVSGVVFWSSCGCAWDDASAAGAYVATTNECGVSRVVITNDGKTTRLLGIEGSMDGFVVDPRSGNLAGSATILGKTGHLCDLTCPEKDRTFDLVCTNSSGGRCLTKFKAE